MSLSSFELTSILKPLCGAGAALAFWGGILGYHVGKDWWLSRLARAKAKASTALMVLGGGLGLATLWVRYLEVNHFPSQTMSEVVTFACIATLISGLVVRRVLRWERYGRNAEGFGYLIQALILLLVAAGLQYVQGQPTTERDLPPALQSYWFPPHIAALVWSYGTLAIAALLPFLYFGIQSWKALLERTATWKSVLRTILAVAALMFLAPVWQVHAFFGGIYFLILLPLALWIHLSKRGFDWLPDWGRTLDEQSFRVFAVGFPFLTAGLMMGALWAQESWANYWGWDSKEVSALLTWFIYLIYLHLRFVVGWRGPRAMKVLVAGAVSILITFQLFGYLPDSQKSLHRYTDPDVVPQEGLGR